MTEIRRRVPNSHFKADGTPKAKLSLDQAKAYVAGKYDQCYYVCDTCGAYHTGRIGLCRCGNRATNIVTGLCDECEDAAYQGDAFGRW